MLGMMDLVCKQERLIVVVPSGAIYNILLSTGLDLLVCNVLICWQFEPESDHHLSESLLQYHISFPNQPDQPRAVKQGHSKANTYHP